MNPAPLDPSTLHLLSSGKLLPVMEHFYTVQGEGHHMGTPAYFVRIGGCDVGCHWCDVKESWNAALHPLTDVESVVELASSHPSRTVVITGGEPLIYNLDHLTHRLHQQGMNIHLETSGAYPFSGTFDWTCLSPKKTSPPKTDVYSRADELKVIIHNRHDFAWAEQHAQQVRPECLLYLQPEWSRREAVMQDVVAYVKENPKWRISLQSHKYMNIP